MRVRCLLFAPFVGVVHSLHSRKTRTLANFRSDLWKKKTPCVIFVPLLHKWCEAVIHTCHVTEKKGHSVENRGYLGHFLQRITNIKKMLIGLLKTCTGVVEKCTRCKSSSQISMKCCCWEFFNSTCPWHYFESSYFFYPVNRVFPR